MKDLLEVVSKSENIFLIENKTFKPFFDNSCIPLLKQPLWSIIVLRKLYCSVSVNGWSFYKNAGVGVYINV